MAVPALLQRAVDAVVRVRYPYVVLLSSDYTTPNKCCTENESFALEARYEWIKEH